MNNLFKLSALLFITTGFTMQAVATPGDNGLGSTPPGLPFATLQEQIDQTNADLDALAADNAASIAALETDVANLQADVSNLQAQIDANDADILALQTETGDNTAAIATLETANADLQDQIDDVNAELLTKQDALVGACSSGSSLRVIYPNGSFICEYDDIQGYVSRTVAYGAWSWVYSRDYQYQATIACPSGWFVSGGGSQTYYTNSSGARLVIAINESRPYGNGWLVTATRTYSSAGNYVRAVANCIRNYH